MGNATSRSTNKTMGSPNGETIGGAGKARGKTAAEFIEKMDMKAETVEVLDSDTFSSSEEMSLMDESNVSDESDDDEEEDEDMMERLRILDDARKLKQLAEAFLYPERPVVMTNETACARNYFNRASAPEQESVEAAEERARILEHSLALKKLAVDYAHPEKPVMATDETACGRSYFARASAQEQESVEEAEERARILEDALALKKLAVDYLHPEMAVSTTDETACARSYFDRAAAPEETEERDLILQDMIALKKLAVEYAHPENPVVITDETACARDYFDRASAPIMESMDLAKERAQVMEEMQLLKKLAIDYAHPELSVVTTDDAVCGRLYFNRASAVEQEDEEEAEEHDLILQDVLALKKLATDYLHPELAVVTYDPTSCGRNYFGRASAPEQKTIEEAEERLRIMEETMALKKIAVDYAHPELPVAVTEATLFGRSYFGRFSAPQQMSAEEAEEYELFMLDAMHLKKFAVDYLYPELAVVTSDEAAGARNYFERASAAATESTEEADERACIMQEMQMLKKFAVDYAHPEIPVVTTDASARGRNYYVRASAPGHACISSTREEDVKIINDDEEDYFMDDCDLQFGKFEEDVLTDWKYQVHKLLDSSHYACTPEKKMTKEEEDVKLSRSPSSVMLFGGYAS